MDAYMRRPLGDLSGYSSVSLTFRYRSQTGDAVTGPLVDYLWVSVSTSAASLPNQAADKEP